MKYDIVFFVPGMPFDGSTLATASLGGSETAGLCMARELASAGHHVTMFSHCDEGWHDGVLYRPADQWNAYARTVPHDISIVQRQPLAYSARLESRINLLWCHDLALARNKEELRGSLWNIDRVMVVSDYHAEQYKQVYGLDDGLIMPTRNGIDASQVPGRGTYARNPKRLVYAARPERGLDVLLHRIMPELLERDPDFELAIYGYDNPVEHMQAFYADLDAKAASFGDRVTFGGHLTKADLYKAYCQAGVYVYPTPSPTAKQFREVSCISAMEAQACGLPIVTSAIGALPETIAVGAGILIGGDPLSDDYVAGFCDAVQRYAADTELRADAETVGRARAAQLDWKPLAAKWEAEFDAIFDQLNDDPVRLAHHFYRRSDIFAADRALQDTPTDATPLCAALREEYAFAGTQQELAAHYAEGGISTDERLTDNDTVAPLFEDDKDDPRFKEIRRLLEDDPDVQTILDFGCGHGWLPVYMERRVGREWTGVDVDPGAVKWAREFADRYGREPANLQFLVGDQGIELGDAQFDCLLISEVLEHTLDPGAVMRSLERWLKPGGLVVCTVPYGPSEYGTWNWLHFRNHLWEFDRHDLRDMFGHRDGFSLTALPEKPNDWTGETVGCHVVTYRKDDTAIGEIDWTRKLRLQRPRQTLSACIIAGPECEDTLRWCLKSLLPVCDEIVIGDTGMSAAARAIAEEAGARLTPAADPKKEGFETPRNQALDACLSDWVLWIDTDERLIDPVNLPKYLRENCWNGLSIHQHHLAVDASLKTDIPVRCFRNRECDGEKIRFYGMIHEHPELGLNKGPGAIVIPRDVHIAHIGYLTESVRRQRFKRNLPLLQADAEKYPDRVLQKHFIMRDEIMMCEYELQQNGNVVTPAVRARAEKVKALWREHIKGKRSKFQLIDNLQYYTRALELLGEGMDVTFDIAAARDGRGDDLNGGYRARFADTEEALEEIAARAEKKLAPLDKADW